MKMLKPEIEFIKFNTEDVITTSGGGGDNPSGDPSKNSFIDEPSNIVIDDTDKSLKTNYNGLSWNFGQ